LSPDAEADRRSVARALVEELRAVIAALTEREIEGERLELARQRAGELRALLTGPRRPRWYDGDPGGVAAADRRAYLDLSPVRGELNPIAPPLVVERVLERDDGSQALVATVSLGPAYEGPPHGVHGGIVAALFDDLLGQAQRFAGRAGVTATLEVRYRQITPLGEPLRMTAWIHEQRGRRVTARATCYAGETLTADAEAIFLGVDFEEIRGRMAERRGGRPG
jgi:acyl-coenzyme A thioesterase PaaI-like protein